MTLDMDSQVPLYRCLAANKASSLPALKRVVWWHQKSQGAEEGCSDHVKALVPLFQDIGVDFECGWSRDFQSTPFGKPLHDWKPFKDQKPVKHWAPTKARKYFGEWRAVCTGKLLMD